VFLYARNGTETARVTSRPVLSKAICRLEFNPPHEQNEVADLRTRKENKSTELTRTKTRRRNKSKRGSTKALEDGGGLAAPWPRGRSGGELGFTRGGGCGGGGERRDGVRASYRRRSAEQRNGLELWRPMDNNRLGCYSAY
jgi:hypothetical protein